MRLVGLPAPWGALPSAAPTVSPALAALVAHLGLDQIASSSGGTAGAEDLDRQHHGLLQNMPMPSLALPLPCHAQNLDRFFKHAYPYCMQVEWCSTPPAASKLVHIMLKHFDRFKFDESVTMAQRFSTEIVEPGNAPTLSCISAIVRQLVDETLASEQRAQAAADVASRLPRIYPSSCQLMPSQVAARNLLILACAAALLDNELSAESAATRFREQAHLNVSSIYDTDRKMRLTHSTEAGRL